MRLWTTAPDYGFFKSEICSLPVSIPAGGIREINNKSVLSAAYSNWELRIFLILLFPRVETSCVISFDFQ